MVVEPGASPQIQRQANVSGHIAGQWQEAEHPGRGEGRLCTSEEPLWAVHSHYWPGDRPRPTNASEKRLQYGPVHVL